MQTIKKTIQKHWILVLTLLTTCYLAIRSSSDPTSNFLLSSLSNWATQFSTGNQIIFDFSIGIIVSLIFYFVVVFLPNKNSKNNIKKNVSNLLVYMLDSPNEGILYWSKHYIHCEKTETEILKLITDQKSKIDNKTLNQWEINNIIRCSTKAINAFNNMTTSNLELSSKHAIIWLALNDCILELSKLYNEYKDTSTETTKMKSVDFDDMSIFYLEFLEFSENWINQEI